MQGDEGCPFPARKQLFPPDFHLEGLESEGKQNTRGQLFSHLNTQFCLPEQKAFIWERQRKRGFDLGMGPHFSSAFFWYLLQELPNKTGDSWMITLAATLHTTTFTIYRQKT